MPLSAAALAERFGLGAAARLSDEPVAAGRQGQLWRLDTGDGRFAVKVILSPVTEEEVARTTAFQEAARREGVTTPQTRRTIDGTILAALDGTTVRVHDWVDVLPADPMLPAEKIGALVAKLHRVDLKVAAEPEEWYSVPVGPSGWDELVAAVGAAGAGFAGELAALRDELVAVESLVRPVRDVRTCHRDLWADNVRATADGGLCVLDFDNAGPAEPAQELACVLFEFGRWSPRRSQALMGAYRGHGGTAVFRDPTDFSMLVCQLGHIVQVAIESWLDSAPGSAQRIECESWVREVLDEPHTRSVLDGLVAAATR